MRYRESGGLGSAFRGGRWLLALVISLGVAAPVSAQEDAVRASVVRVQATHRHPNPTQPWLRAPAHEANGTGFVIEGGRILTSAHIVEYATQVQVAGERAGDPRSAARVEVLALEVDLALLKVEDPGFLKDRPALPLESALPRARQEVTVYGYPIGGTGLSLTQGIVSRIDYGPYPFRGAGLRIQIDAAINPGNSGGPALVDGKVAGIVFGRLGDEQGIGYLIPVLEIEAFLRDAADGRYDGKPYLPDAVQALENPALRRRLGVPDELTGIVVNRPTSEAPDALLQRWDVITHVGDLPVGNQGEVRLRDDLTVSVEHAVQAQARDRKVPLKVWRQGKSLAVNAPVRFPDQLAVPGLRGALPSYFVCGPLVFTVATEDLLTTLDAALPDWSKLMASRSSPLVSRRYDWASAPDEQLVILASGMFAHPVGQGYNQACALQTVASVNGVRVKNLAQLARLIRDSRDEYLEIAFVDNLVPTMVFDRRALLQATAEVLDDNGIRRPCSEDLAEVWTLP